MSETAASAGATAPPPFGTGVYPGTFDPVHNGHLDVIARAARIARRLVVGVATSAGKQPLFPLDERVELLRAELAPLAERTGARIEARPFEGLLIGFAREVGASVIVRGLRAVSDFDYEFQMAGMNSRLDPTIETVFLMAGERHHFISSRFVKEVAELGGDISSFVPRLTLERMLARLAARAGSRGSGARGFGSPGSEGPQ
jgi:pantetheine-phosphate adenylyltransferase